MQRGDIILDVRVVVFETERISCVFYRKCFALQQPLHELLEYLQGDSVLVSHHEWME